MRFELNISAHMYLIKTGLYWKNNWFSMVRNALANLGVLWLGISLGEYFIEDFSFPTGMMPFLSVVSFATVLGVLYQWPRLRYTSTLRGTDIKISVIVGDIFKQKADIVLATNTTFDTTFEKTFISRNSLQGQLTTREYDSVEHLDAELNSELSSVTAINFYDRKISKNDQYSVGTTVKLNHRSGLRSYWLAIADVNEDGKPESDIDDLRVGLTALWVFLSKNGHLNKIALPLLGTGFTGMPGTRSTIYREILSSFVAYSDTSKLTEDFVICIFPGDLLKGKINFYEMCDYLEYLCSYGHK